MLSLFTDFFFFFFFNDTATTEIYTLSLHDALPICWWESACRSAWASPWWWRTDRKSTRLNSSHANISYAVFCLKKKKKNIAINTPNVNNRANKRDGTEKSCVLHANVRTIVVCIISV